jgi:hypothetical protein
MEHQLAQAQAAQAQLIQFRGHPLPMQAVAAVEQRRIGLQAARLAQVVAEKVKEVTALPHKVQQIRAAAVVAAAHR